MEKIKEEVIPLTENMRDLLDTVDGDMNIFLKILERFEGEQLYFPKGISKKILHDRIRAEYKEQVRDPRKTSWLVCSILGAKYGYSVKRIQQLIME